MAKSSYSSCGRALEKQTKIIEEHCKKQFEGGIYPFKTTNLHLIDLERTLVSELQTTVLIKEGMSDIQQYYTSSKQHD